MKIKCIESSAFLHFGVLASTLLTLGCDSLLFGAFKEKVPTVPCATAASAAGSTCPEGTTCDAVQQICLPPTPVPSGPTADFFAARVIPFGIRNSLVAAQVAADLTGDGNADLLVGYENGQTQLLTGRGDGTFDAPKAFFSPLQATVGAIRGLEAADFDGDGLVDAVLQTSDSLLVIKRASDGSTSVLSSFQQSGLNTFTVGDLNADGKPDLAAAMVGAVPYVMAIYNDGSGGLTLQSKVMLPTTTAPLAIRTYRSLSSKVADLVVFCEGKFLFLTNSRGNEYALETGRTLTPTAKITWFTTADLDGDEASDLVAVGLDGATQKIPTVLISFGKDPKNPRTVAVTSMMTMTGETEPSLTDVVVANIQGDATPELLVGSEPTAGFQVLTKRDLNVDYQSLGQRVWLAPLRGHLRTADFNKDGLADIVELSNQPSSRAVLALGTPSGLKYAPTHTLQGPPVGLAVGDFEGDFRPDVAAAISTTNQGGLVEVVLNQAGGLTSTNIGSSLMQPTVILSAPVDGDARPDLYLGTQNGIVPLLNRGNKTFTIQSPLNMSGSSKGLASADLDGDGLPDLLSIEGSSSTRVYRLLEFLTRGMGKLTESHVLDLGADPGGVTTLDWDQNGRVDVAVTDTQNGAILLYGNGASAELSPGPVLKYPALTSPLRVASADLNRDGLADLIVTRVASAATTAAPLLLLGKGAGVFEAPIVLPVGTAPSRVIVGDYNSDQSLDLAFTDADTAALWVILGDGKGGFGPATGFQCGSLVNTDAVTADLDQDGDLDLIASSSDQNLVFLLRNLVK